MTILSAYTSTPALLAKRAGVEVYALKIVIDLPELKLLELLPVFDLILD